MKSQAKRRCFNIHHTESQVIVASVLVEEHILLSFVKRG
jgi:hypothetical protein